ncbi:TerB family tellurite resistance protein [Terrilactibacillus sp. S3-3]|nr:TerB family tellurite resistance protein [Terrilactibacillus sp. S3-3]
MYFTVQGREDILRDFLTVLFAIAFADGSLDIDEEQMIRYAVTHLA